MHRTGRGRQVPVLEPREACPIALRQPAGAVGKEPWGCRGSGLRGQRGPQGMLAMLVGDTWSVTGGVHWHDDTDAVSLPPRS